MVLACTSVGAQATGRARITSACPNETVTVLELKPVAVTLRFVLHGVSCTKAHSLIRTYFRHEATPGYCRNRGNICAFVAGGWTCSLPLYAGEGGGDFAACLRENPFEQVKVYRVSQETPPSVAARCQANALGISLTDVGAYSFHTGLAIEFMNRGSACTITGYPGVDAVSATGRRILSAKRTKSGYIGGVLSGPIPKVHLAKGETASALVEWVDGGPLGVPCPHVHSLRITPPGAVSSVILSPKSLTTETLCGVQVHPVVPGRSGRKT